MKKYIVFFGLGLMIAVSVVYARRGPADNVFDSVTTHPLAGYGDQIIEPPLPNLMAPAAAAGELELFE